MSVKGVLLSPYMLLRASFPDSVARNVPHYSPAFEE